MRTALAFCLIINSAFFLGACSDDSSVGEESGEGLDDIQAINPADPLADAGGESSEPEWDSFGEEGTDDAESHDVSDAGPSSGGFGDPCSENQDCDSGLCVENYDGSVCTDFCVDQCPKGWACKDVSGASPDVIYACVPTAVDLCKPCDQNTDCGGSSDLCARLDEGADFGYCGVSCDVDIDCPDGFSCISAETMDGETHTQCIPTDGDCVCPPGALPGTAGCDIVTNDQDEDGIPDDQDNCPTHPNSDQENTDGDEWGDACDPDDDNDEDPDTSDCEPLNPAIYTGAEELCDGIDNNCNDLIDEGFADSDNDGTADCMDPDDDNDTDPDEEDCEPLNPLVYHGAEELCDGIDNNCNDEIDEGFEDNDGDGILDCLDDDSDNDGDPDSSDCEPYDPAINNLATEVCDGIDNDCDTLIDEGYPNFDNDDLADCVDDDDDNDGDPDTEDCAPFNPAVYHNAPDLCDGLDNDCDGVIDQAYDWVGNVCDGDDSDLCGNGTYTCSPDGLSVVCVNEVLENISEVCNSNDDDCDGQIDEDFPSLGEICDGNDSDSCENGVYACDPISVNVVCVELGSDAIEICNNVDDDCDGQIDEGFTKSEEICNGLDDDCDGLTDEDFSQLGQACDGSDDDECAQGTFTCTPDGTGVHCINEPFNNNNEICNGIDDDCDGEIDENYWQLGEPCDGDDPDVCANGVYTCDATGFNVVCENEFPSNIVELCNGFDDDCDGGIDEDFSGLNSSCDGDDADSCATGSWSCTEDGLGLECINETQMSMSEICNGFDEDCDGQIDEDFSELGMACDGDDADSCALGVYTCSPDGTGVVCTGEDLVGITEVCNGVDDDCDGDIDETGCLTIGGVPVQPYTSTSSVQDWYSYSVPAGSSANANLAIANQAIVYFHQDQNGNLSLVLTLDIPQDSSGGTTVLEINGATGMDILVSDDGGEATMNGSSGTGVGDFNWLACCTDGLVLGYWTSSSCITLDVTSATGINSWVVLSGDGTQETLPGAFNGSSLEVCGQP